MKPDARNLVLLLSIALLEVASHLGGSMTNGRDFLTRYAPTAMRTLVRPFMRDAKTELTEPLMQQPVFVGIVEPILEQRCVSCHGAEKHKAGLRLDTLEGLLQGGQDGPVIVAGQAKDSTLIQCMLSPLDADGHMPPEEHPQANVEEISLLVWWINDGAPAATRVADLKPKPEIRRLLELVSQRTDPAKGKEAQ